MEDCTARGQRTLWDKEGKTKVQKGFVFVVKIKTRTKKKGGECVVVVVCGCLDDYSVFFPFTAAHKSKKDGERLELSVNDRINFFPDETRELY